MIYVKDHKQRDMFNPFAHLGAKRLALLESSWAHLFREEILHNLPAEKLFQFYDEFKGRKTKELYAMLGLVLIQQMEDCSDSDAIDNFALNLKWQYALNITDESDAASYVSPRTLWNLRDIVAQHGLHDALFENVTNALKKLFTLDPSKQRLDSVHLFSNMAHLVLGVTERLPFTSMVVPLLKSKWAGNDTFEHKTTPYYPTGVSI